MFGMESDTFISTQEEEWQQKKGCSVHNNIHSVKVNTGNYMVQKNNILFLLHKSGGKIM
jgi:hypothetical protein